MTAGSFRTASGVPSAIFNAVVEDVDAVGEMHHQVELVLDQEDGHAARFQAFR